MPRRLALIATSLALVVALAGCGSDDDKADEKDTTTTTEEDASTTTTQADDETDASTAPDETTTESTETTEPTETTEAPEDPGGTATTISIPEGADFCAAYGAFDESASNLADDTIENVQAGAEAIRDAIAQLAPLAPAELADAMALLVDATEELVDTANAATTLEEAKGALTEVFSQEQFRDAAQSVSDYFTASCAQANDDQAPETVTPG